MPKQKKEPTTPAVDKSAKKRTRKPAPASGRVAKKEKPAAIQASRPPGDRKSGLVAIVGRTNTGKSTLLNRILGRKISIVSDKPQTTRHRILGVLTEERGQAVFFDTPGVHKPGHEMNRRMVQFIYDALLNADILLHLVDISQSFGHGEQFVLDVVKKTAKPSILVINKIDLVAKGKILEVIDYYRQQHPYAAFVPVSALTGDGVPVLLEELYNLLPAGEFFYEAGLLTDQPERFLIAERVRERVLVHTREELPYTTAVVIDHFDESRREGENLLRVEASIVVERESQKGILIGRQGSQLKTIGTEARLEIEALLGCRVYLGLYVKVEPEWRENVRLLDQMGLIR